MTNMTDYRLPVMDVEDHPDYKMPTPEYKGLTVPAVPLEGGAVNSRVKTKTPKNTHYDED